MKKRKGKIFFIAAIVATISMFAMPVSSQDLWSLARDNSDVLTISTLFIAQDVRDHLSTREGLDDAVRWCKQTGITKVYIETFRGGYYADKDDMIRARDRFRSEGFSVAGCVTTVNVGKNGVGGWGATACYTNDATLEEMDKIFRITASLFDLIMIDDFLFTECTCEDCITAKGDKSWSRFRCDMMVDMARNHILKPAREINPKVKIIIKYPLWYDSFHERGYDVVRESQDFDYTWVGTETRDYDYDVRPGGEVQYNAYFISRWMNLVSGGKNGGGWMDALGTTPKIYVEQARQTVLGNERELMLFHYGGLLDKTNFYDGKPGTPVEDVKAFRNELPGLFELAKIVKDKPVKGIQIPKLPDSDPMNEPYVFSFIGMLGLPLVPADRIDPDAPSSIFTVHALKEPGFSSSLGKMLAEGKSVTITDDLAKLISDQSLLKNSNLAVLTVGGEPKNLLKLSRDELLTVREHLLKPFGMMFDAPNKVSLYLLEPGYAVIENFNDYDIDATLDLPATVRVEKLLTLPEDGNAVLVADKNRVEINNLSPRSLVVFRYK